MPSEEVGGLDEAAEKYMVFAEQADQDGFPNVARLFRAISFAETRHARNHLRTLGGIKRTAGNLQTAYEGESFEIDEMYPAYQEVAKVEGDRQALRSMTFAIKAEMDHKTMYAAAREQVLGGDDIDDQPVSVCLICGHTVIGEVPDRCPVCAATKAYYHSFV